MARQLNRGRRQRNRLLISIHLRIPASVFPLQVLFSFDENGNFKRQDKSRVEEGAYLIGTRGEFVMYIEKINGELLGAARVDHYAIIDQRDDSITLESSPSKKLVLRKR